MLLLAATLLTVSLPAVSITVQADPAAPTGETAAPMRVLLPAARDVNAPGGLPLRRLLDIPMRDPNVMRGPDGAYYLVGTTDPAPGYTSIGASDLTSQMWTINDGIRMWRSPDLVHWKSLGLIWSLDRDGTWAHWWKGANPGSAVWAPELHYVKGNWWIAYCAKMPGEGLHIGAGLLRSVSGRPEGPYRDVQPDAPLALDDDASLFQDTDGAVYFLWDGFHIARMKDDMSGLAEAPRTIQFARDPGWGEGIFLVKDGGKYIFINSGTALITPDLKNPPPGRTTYDCFSAVSTGSIYGPYTIRRRAIPHDGHNNLFQDSRGRWWATYFGSDPWAPFSIGASGRPAVLPVTISPDGTLRAARTKPRPVWQYLIGPDTGWKTGGGAFGDPVVAQNGNVTDVGTVWTHGSLELRRTLTIRGLLPEHPALYVRHSGTAQVFLNGKAAASLVGGMDDYAVVPLAEPSLLRVGLNTVTVQAAPGSGPAYIDVGLVDVPPTPVAVPIVFTSEATGQSWHWTVDKPGAGWAAPGFADAAWSVGPALFGNAVPGVNKPWTTGDIWLRRTFTLDRPILSPRLRLFHDEDAEVYIDGLLAATRPPRRASRPATRRFPLRPTLPGVCVCRVSFKAADGARQEIISNDK